MNSPLRRLFIALPIDEKTVSELKNLNLSLKRFSPILKIVPPENYHITVKFFGEVSADRAEIIISAFGSLGVLPVIRYTIAGCGAFPSIERASVLWAGMDCEEKPLMELFNTVERFSLSLGFPAESRKFVPHLTLARIKRDKKPTRELVEFLRSEKNTSFAASVFNRLVLFESRLLKGGAEYTAAAEINLL